MANSVQRPTPAAIRNLATELVAECDRVVHPATVGKRRIRRAYSKLVRDWPPSSVLQLARMLCQNDDDRWLAYEMVFNHRGFAALRRRQLEQLGKGVNSW